MRLRRRLSLRGLLRNLPPGRLARGVRPTAPRGRPDVRDPAISVAAYELDPADLSRKEMIFSAASDGGRLAVIEARPGSGDNVNVKFDMSRDRDEPDAFGFIEILQYNWTYVHWDTEGPLLVYRGRGARRPTLRDIRQPGVVGFVEFRRSYACVCSAARMAPSSGGTRIQPRASSSSRSSGYRSTSIAART